MNLSCLTPTIIKNPAKADVERYITVPCNQCAICRKRRAAQWSIRLMNEHRDSLPGCSYFITLTYNNEEVPRFNGKLSLWTPDWQKFWKRFRKCQPEIPVKYYGVGEYGGRYARPHWHAIAFNILSPEWIRDSWNLGIVHLDEVNMATISYVTGYVTKPPPDLAAEKAGLIERTRPFMSKGLGKSYITPQTVKYHNERLDQCYITQEGGRKISMPRYYKEKIYYEESLRLLKIKLKAMSKQKAAEALAKFMKDFPNEDPDQWRWEYVRQAINYDNINQRNKRNKL